MDTKALFSDRAEDYARARPAYALQAVEFLRNAVGLGLDSTIADVGCGTGIFACQLLATGAQVIGVEPNAEMRRYAESSLGERFQAMDGSAEDMPLPDGSVNLVTAAQAFHWFDLGPTKTEFQRVLRPPGWVALIWNVRETENGGIAAEYEEAVAKWSPDYAGYGTDERADITSFFHPAPYERLAFDNAQYLDWETFRDRAYSASYFPASDHPDRGPATNDLRRIFETFAVDGLVVMPYRTELFFGQLKSS